MINIIKRDGNKELFDVNKIKTAIMKSMVEANSVDDVILNDVAYQVEQVIKNNNDVEFTVEEIQDMVEESLMTSGAVKAAKRYILYRNKRNEVRNKPWELSDLQAGIINNKYYADGEDFNKWVKRISAGDKKLEKLIRDKKFLFAGRILANRDLKDDKKLTYSNCYVL